MAETLTLECIREHLIDVLAAVNRAVRYNESRLHVGDPARRQFTDKILRELREAQTETLNIDLELRRHIEHFKERR